MKIQFSKALFELYFTFTILGLVACASIQTYKAQHLSWKIREQQLSTISTWNLHGSLNVNYRNESHLTHFNWVKTRNSDTVLITSPFSVGGIKIISDPNGATLWRSTNNKVTAKNVEDLMLHSLGWKIPLANMHYWVVGRPTPKIKYSAKFDPDNHLILLSQDGWQISYGNYISVANIELPSYISLINSVTKIKLSIKNWAF